MNQIPAIEVIETCGDHSNIRASHLHDKKMQQQDETNLAIPYLNTRKSKIEKDDCPKDDKVKNKEVYEPPETSVELPSANHETNEDA